MSRKTHTVSPYSSKLCHKTVRFVFDTVYFTNPRTRYVLRDSYFFNIGIMRQYARDNGIDEIEYLLGIRDTLLKSKGVYDRY
jgi:hypothetical protein